MPNLPEPMTREQFYLKAIAENGSGGGSSSGGILKVYYKWDNSLLPEPGYALYWDFDEENGPERPITHDDFFGTVEENGYLVVVALPVYYDTDTEIYGVTYPKVVSAWFEEYLYTRDDEDDVRLYFYTHN